MGRLKRVLISLIASLFVLLIKPPVALADFWGGDVIVLTQILSNTVQQLAQLRAILGAGQDTLGLMRDINSGLKDGLSVIQIISPQFDPGVLGNVDDVNKVIETLGLLYGQVPKSPDSKLMAAQDLSVAESLSMNSKIYKYADQVDLEKDRIAARSHDTSPQGSAKLQNQALAVLIGVTTQVLRTNSAMLKLMAENLALQNRKDKLSTEQFNQQYEGISQAIKALPEDPKLPRFDRGGE